MSVATNTTSNSNNTTNSKNRIHFRSLKSHESEDGDDGLQHFAAALQVLAHVLGPVRKGLIHFSLMYKTKDFLRQDPIEWRTLHALGSLLKELIAPPPATVLLAVESNSQNSDEEEESIPVDPTRWYTALQECLVHLKLTTKPRDAAQALQLLLDVLQRACRTLPVTGPLWSALLDSSGLGLVVKQVFVVALPQQSGELLQRTKKESTIEWCPLVLPLHVAESNGEASSTAPKRRITSLDEGLQRHCSKVPQEGYDFDKEDFDFEVRIPLLAAPSKDCLLYTSPSPRD